MKKLSSHSDRNAEFEASSGGGSASQDLLSAANMLLLLALHERPNRAHPPGNINTQYAPGAVMLRMAGFEAFLNEGLAVLEDPFGKTPKMKHLAALPFLDKYKAIFQLQTAQPAPNTDELDVAIHARNEVVHYLPRDRSQSKTLSELDRRGLLIPSNFIGHGLESYNLALWVFKVTQRYAVDLANALQNIPNTFFAPQLIYLSKNFEIPPKLRI